ncbi:MAG: hypothetical protein L6R40_007822 [Gallowayella cf. fulva]|nr:MAG: hypothetical protein L6R40_007822 [Xanthomendoza cf. fulva]
MLLCTTLLLLISFLVHATPLDQPHRTLSSSKLKPRHYDSAINAAHAKRQGNPILRASFTSNPTCGQTISCNAGKYNTHTGVKGIGATAVNGMLFGGAPGVYDGSSGYKNVNGVGGACGSCWTLTPGYNYHESNGKSLGHTVVVRINDACTDKGYCDQSPAHPLNTGPLDKMQPSGKYDGQVHFDLCQATGVSAAFFGATNGGLNAGVAIGAAQYNPDCTGLEDGNFGGSTVSNLAMPFDMPGGQSQGTATDNKPVEHGTQAQKGKKSQQKQEFNTTTDAADGAQPEKSEELPVMGGSQSQTNTTDPATNPSGQGIEQQQQKGPTSQQKQELAQT